VVRDLNKLMKSVGRTLDLLSGISLVTKEIVSDFLFICKISIFPVSCKGIPLPVETDRTPVGTIDSLWRK
jgi:hypothetical protein